MVIVASGTTYAKTVFLSFFFFNDTATTEIYTLSLHDALPIFGERLRVTQGIDDGVLVEFVRCTDRSEEHTSELQSQSNLVCRLLLEKKKKNTLYTPCHSSSDIGLAFRRTLS